MSGRALSSFEQLVIARPFKCDLERLTWSRVLKPMIPGKPYGYVELIFNPSSPVPANLFLIERHTRAMRKQDMFASTLPTAVQGAVNRVVNNDLLLYVLYGPVSDDLELPVPDTLLTDFASSWPLADVLSDPHVLQEGLVLPLHDPAEPTRPCP